MSTLLKLRLLLSGSSLSAQKGPNGIRTAGVVCVLKHFQARMLTGWSCRTFREKKNSGAPAVKREAEEE
jgi:hypothetical protein